MNKVAHYSGFFRFCVQILVSALLVIMFIGCGGGFKDDSKGARDLGEAIFGPDSLR